MHFCVVENLFNIPYTYQDWFAVYQNIQKFLHISWTYATYKIYNDFWLTEQLYVADTMEKNWTSTPRSTSSLLPNTGEIFPQKTLTLYSERTTDTEEVYCSRDGQASIETTPPRPLV